MKNLLKDKEPLYCFKPNCLEYDTKYELEIDGNIVVYKTTPKHEPIHVHSGHELKERPTPFIMLSNELFQGDSVPEPKPGYCMKHSGSEHLNYYIPNIIEMIKISAIHVMKGIVRIRKFNDTPTPWMNVDDLITVEYGKSIDFDKIKPGQIWKLTIDEDPRFQNTIIMILSSPEDYLKFVYQTKVIYSPEYSQTDTAEGRIDLYDSTGEMNDLDKVHLELVTDNTNPYGAILDRTQKDKYIYPSSFDLGYKERYPELPPRTRERIMNDE